MKFQKKVQFFLQCLGLKCSKYQVFSSKTVTGNLPTYIDRTKRGSKQDKPEWSQNTSPGPVVVHVQYGVVKQYSLVNSTGFVKGTGL